MFFRPKWFCPYDILFLQRWELFLECAFVPTIPSQHFLGARKKHRHVREKMNTPFIYKYTSWIETLVFAHKSRHHEKKGRKNTSSQKFWCVVHIQQERITDKTMAVCVLIKVSVFHTHTSWWINCLPTWPPVHRICAHLSLSSCGIRPLKLTWNTFFYSLGHFRCKLNTQECVFKLTLCVLKTFHIFLRRFTFFCTLVSYAVLTYFGEKQKKRPDKEKGIEPKCLLDLSKCHGDVGNSSQTGWAWS